MGVADRLTTAGGGDGSVVIAPTKVGTQTATTVFDDGLNADGSTDASGDAKNVLRPDPSPEYDSESLTRDVRSLGGNSTGRTVYVNSDAAGADTFTLSFTCDPDTIPGYVAGTADADGVFTTGALNDDDSAATIQTAVRLALPGTDLTVIEGPGPDFYIIFDREFWGRRYPAVTFNGTGCTASVTVVSDVDQDTYGTVLISARDAEIGALGESRFVSHSDSILRPTIGTITVTAGTDEVHTVTASAGTDGGTFGLHYVGGAIPGVRQATKGRCVIDYNENVVDFQSKLDYAMGNDAPTVTLTTGAEVQTMDLNDVAENDTFKIATGGGTTAKTALITVLATGTLTAAAIQTALNAVLGANMVAVTVSHEMDIYTITFNEPGNKTEMDVTDVTGFTPDTPDIGGFATATAGAGDFVYTLTFESGELAGRPVGATRIYAATDDLLTDGGVSEPATYAVATPGVLGSASAAYTERGSGDTVLAAAVRDRDGKTYGFANDAATPVVFSSLPPGAYHMVARTVEDGRVSKATSKAFTVTST